MANLTKSETGPNQHSTPVANGSLSREFATGTMANYPGLDNNAFPQEISPIDADAAQLQPSLHPQTGAVEIEEAGVKRESLHPVQTPPPLPHAGSTEDKVRAVDEFVARLMANVDEDYGDWMRSVNADWVQLSGALADEDEVVESSMQEILSRLHLRRAEESNDPKLEIFEIAMRIRRALGATDDVTLQDYGTSVSDLATGRLT